MTLARSVGELNDVADAAALDPDRWVDFLELLAEKTHDSTILFQVADLHSSRWTPILSRGFSEKALQDYSGYFASISPWRDLLVGLKEGQTVWADEHIPIKTLHRTEFYNDLLRQEGEVDSSTGLNLISDRSRRASIAIHYSSKSTERMNDLATSLLNGVSVRMRQAINVNQALASSSSQFTTDTSLLLSLAEPAAIVDQSGRVLASNDALVEFATQYQRIRIGGDDRLDFGSAELQSAFLRQLRERSLGGGDLVARYPEMSISIAVLPIRPNVNDVRGIAGLFPVRRHFLAIFRVMARPLLEEATAERLAMRYRLTPAETRLVVALGRGTSINAMAESLSISRHTIRSQLKSVFGKTQTHSQIELVALLLHHFRI
ncbi:helix-turn-helix transcriptional regulator [Kaistia granuli]|uniref:helix-turn-helix transcriptional regulator n=1 Tax=Kaistia granuli TaxID=363259 RepID=UPI0003692043|nr:hypothetical protein [Kaistia granuli]